MAFERSWNVKYRFSIENEETFFKSPIDCFLFYRFAIAPDIETFYSEKKLKKTVKKVMNDDEQKIYNDRKKKQLKQMLETLKEKARNNQRWQKY